MRRAWFVLACLLPGTAWAGNSSKPRAAPSFFGVACLEQVDQQEPMSFELGIPWEDVDLTEDEPADSRRFQFFALCREPEPTATPPNWISADDVMRSQAVDPTIEAPNPDDVLETSLAWADCAVPINGAQERIPITCPATASGVQWDVSAVEPGAYAIWGYTFEPAANLWTRRGGVVRVVGADPDAAGPAVALSFPAADAMASLGTGIVLRGCAAGAAGTSVAVSWATAPELEAAGDAAWRLFEEFEASEAFEVAFVPPPEAENQAVYFRAVATDPQGRAWTSYVRDPVVFIGGCERPEGGNLKLPDHCKAGPAEQVPEPPDAAQQCDGGTGSTGTGASTDGDTTGSTGPGATGDGGGSDGCGCSGSATGAGGVRSSGFGWLLFAFIAVARGGRRT